MEYTKTYSKSVEYKGESFSREIDKTDGSAWEDNETAVFRMIDPSGSVVTYGDLTRSDSKLLLEFFIGKTITSNLLGTYVILVYMNDAENIEVNYVLAEYNLRYVRETARNIE